MTVQATAPLHSDHKHAYIVVRVVPAVVLRP